VQKKKKAKKSRDTSLAEVSQHQTSNYMQSSSNKKHCTGTKTDMKTNGTEWKTQK
jgi:hypothetical protein